MELFNGGSGHGSYTAYKHTMNTNISELTMMQRAYVRPKWGLDYLRIISASIVEEGCGSTYEIGIYMATASTTTSTSATPGRTASTRGNADASISIGSVPRAAQDKHNYDIDKRDNKIFYVTIFLSQVRGLVLHFSSIYLSCCLMGGYANSHGFYKL